MKTNQAKTIWTIGHSTHSLDEFVAMLHSFEIEIVVDIRSFPGSRKFPQFNKEALEVSLPENKIEYTLLKKLGGRRKVNPESKTHLGVMPPLEVMRTIWKLTHLQKASRSS